MATNKNLLSARAALLLLAAAGVLLAGCGPPGPRALKAGKKLIEQGKYDAAIEELSLATQKMPTNAHAWNYIGIAFQHAGQPDRATRAYDCALQLNHDLIEAYYNRGCLFLEQNLPDRAKVEFTSFTLRAGKSAAGWMKLGAAQLRSRDLPGAEKSLKQALTLSPDNAEALNDLGVVEWQSGRQRDALAHFQDALAREPHYAAAILNLAVATQSAPATHSFALQKYKQYLALNPRPPNWEAVSTIARQLDAELNPPARPAVSGPVVTPPMVAPTVAAVRSPTNLPARPAVAAVSNPPKPEQPVEVPRPVLQPAARPVAETQPEPKPDVVQLPEAQSVKVAENVSAPTRTAPTPAPAKSAVTPLPSPKAASPSPPTLTGVGRYKYISPDRPVPGDRAEAERLVAQGATAQQERRFKDAENFYRSAVAADPAFLDAQTGLGGVAAELDHLPQSLLAYETALAINPGSFVARFNFARTLARANYQQDAAQELERVLASGAAEAPARLATVHLTLANLYADYFHRPEFARPHYAKVLELDPQNPQATAIRYWLNDNP